MADVIAGLEAQLSVDSKDVNAGIANARAMMDRLESEMRRLTEEEKKGILATADYAAKMNELQAASQRLGAGLQSAFSRSGSAVQSMDAMGRSSGSFARGMLDISRGVEDFATGGFLGVLNNIPGAFSNMAAAAGLTGPMVAGLTTGVSLLATAAYVLYRNWDTLVGTMGSKKFEDEADEMERLAKATERTADQEERLSQLRKEAKQTKEQREARPASEKAGETAIGKAIGEAGGLDAIIGAIIPEMPKIDTKVTDAEVEELVMQREKESITKGSRGVFDPAKETEKARGELEQKRTDQAAALNRQAAERLMRDAQFGTGETAERARQQILDIGRRKPGSIPQEVLEAIGESTESGRKLAEEMEAGPEIAARDEEARSEAEKEELDKFDAEEEVFQAGNERRRMARERRKAREKVELEEFDAAEEVFQAGNARHKELRETRDKTEIGVLEREGEASNFEGRRVSLEDRIYDLMHPHAAGQSLGIQAYEASIKAGGEDKQLQELRKIRDLDEEIRDFNRDAAILRIKHR
jgi:hypothetical protein